MKRTSPLCFVVPLLLAVTAASAQLMTGNDVLDACEGPLTGGGTRSTGGTPAAKLLPSKPDLPFCYGYLTAITDAVGTRNSSVYGEWAACLPTAGFQLSQAKDVIMRYLHAHPEERHQNAALLAGAALAEAWPCPAK